MVYMQVLSHLPKEDMTEQTEYVKGVDKDVASNLIQGGSQPTAKGTVQVAGGHFPHFYVTELEGKRFLLAIPPEAEATKVSSYSAETQWSMVVERDETSGVILRVNAIERSADDPRFVNVISKHWPLEK